MRRIIAPCLIHSTASIFTPGPTLYFFQNEMAQLQLLQTRRRMAPKKKKVSTLTLTLKCTCGSKQEVGRQSIMHASLAGN